jgi:hypothetical protein
MNLIVWLAIGVALIAIVMLLRRPRPIVLGTQLASAFAAEKQRLARGGHGPSPMPPGGYSSVEANLNAPVQSPFDLALRDFVRRYAAADPDTRMDMRDATSMDELYTLLTFASRQAVFAMQRNEASYIDDALAALAMLDLERIDWRDGMGTADLVLHAAGRFETPPRGSSGQRRWRTMPLRRRCAIELRGRCPPCRIAFTKRSPQAWSPAASKNTLRYTT